MPLPPCRPRAWEIHSTSHHDPLILAPKQRWVFLLLVGLVGLGVFSQMLFKVEKAAGHRCHFGEKSLPDPLRELLFKESPFDEDLNLYGASTEPGRSPYGLLISLGPPLSYKNHVSLAFRH